jgi:hypothetical protein
MEEPAPSPSPKEGNSDSIEEVRDLLFGKRTAEISGRIEETEHILRDSIFRMEERVECKLGVLEGLMEDQLKSMGAKIENMEARVKLEAGSRVQQEEDYKADVEKVEASFSEKLNSIEERFHKFETIIWSEMHSLSRKQHQEMSDMKLDLLKRIEDEVSQVNDTTADLTKLGEFLIDLGLKIQPEKRSVSTSSQCSETQPELPG